MVLGMSRGDIGGMFDYWTQTKERNVAIMPNYVEGSTDQFIKQNNNTHSR